VPRSRRDPKDVFGKELSRLIASQNLSQHEIGRRLGVTQTSLSYWLSGRSLPRAGLIPGLARILGVSDLHLVRLLDPASYSPSIADRQSRIRRVPVISWTRAATWSATDADEASEGEVVDVLIDSPRPAFALRVISETMAPQFLPGTTIVVQPATEARHGSFVIVRLDVSAEAILRQYVIEGAQYYLRPLNTQFPALAVDARSVLIGVVVQQFRRYEEP
jgi:SOS-response transcriptional repressor LexA